MNEVASAFWSQENRFWVITNPSTEKTYIGFLNLDLVCECGDLSIDNHITVELSMEDLGTHLTESQETTIWNLETNGITTMSRKVKEWITHVYVGEPIEKNN